MHTNSMKIGMTVPKIGGNIDLEKLQVIYAT